MQRVRVELEKRILGGIKVELAEGDTIASAKIEINGISHPGVVVGDYINFFTPPHRFPHDPVWLPFNLPYVNATLTLVGNFTALKIIPQYSNIDFRNLLGDDYNIPIHSFTRRNLTKLSPELAEEGYNNYMWIICGSMTVRYCI
ncbi:hypothetical protein BNJ_00189 [Kaumoebavirus]|uniref:hypothetical protein n=1 Tax=Kaumoebavirus TaxID=1859492 RepID=UPI0009C1F22D|nr:hypothetical protein BNJ_00189 [Kaumoebavirus]ARA72020.1 hypothetical protein BNJ_00189 [Kaumoebavirus]